MSDLMPCQMCGGKAKLIDSNAYRSFVECSNKKECAINGKIVSFSDDPNRFEVPTNEPWVFEKAIINWNEMQTYIARGKLLDAAPTSKGGRL